MATEQPVPITPGSGANISTVVVGGNDRQVVVIGDPNTQVGFAPVDPTLGVSVNVKNPALSINGNTITSLAKVNTASPAYSDGQFQPPSLDTAGNLRVNVVAGGAGGGVAQLQANNSSNVYTAVGYFPGNIPVPVQVQNGITVSSMPSVTVLQGTSPWVTSGGSSGGVTPVIAATSNGLTVNGSFSATFPSVQNVQAATTNGLTINGAVTVSGTVNANLVSSSAQPVLAAVSNGLTITGTVAVSGTPTVSVTASVPNLTLTSIPSITGAVSITGTPTVTVSSASSTLPVQAATSNGLTVNGSVTVSGTVNANLISSAAQPVLAATSNGMTINGTVAVTESGTWTVQQGTPPWSMQAATSNGLTVNGAVTQSGAWSVAATSTFPVQAASTNGLTVYQGGAPASAAAPWIVSNLIGNTITIMGNQSDNTASSTTKIGTLPARANASSPSWSEGNQVPLSTDLTGALRVSGAAGGGVAQVQTRSSANAWTDVGYATGDLTLPVAVENGLTIQSMPAINVTIGTTPVIAATSNGLTVNGSFSATFPPVQNVQAATSNGMTVYQGAAPSSGSNPWNVTVNGNTISVYGTGTDNTANSTQKLPVLSARANASAPSWSEGNMIPLSTDLSGALRVSGAAGGGVAQVQTRSSGNAWTDVGYFTGDLNLPVAVENGLTIQSMPAINVTIGTTPVIAATSNGLTVNGSFSASISGTQQVIAATSNGLTVNGTVAVTQSTSPWLVSNLNGNTITVVQTTAANLNSTVTGSVSITGTPNVSVTSSVPNLTLTSLPTLTINSPSVTQGTSPWVISSSTALPVQSATSNGLTINGTVTVSGTINANLTSSVPQSVQAATTNGLTVTGTVTNNQGTNPWIVNVSSSVPNLTLTSLPTVTINSPSVTQGTSPWIVSSLNGNTITALGSGALGAPSGGVMTVQGATNMIPLLVSEVPWPGVGSSTYRNINLQSTGSLIKGAPGSIVGWYMFNNATAVRYVKFYNKATSPSVGSDIPYQTLPLPPGSVANLALTSGVGFTNGIGISGTVNVADSDSTAPSANDLVVNIFYE